MTDLDSRLKEIKERCEAATEGEWRFRNRHTNPDDTVLRFDSITGGHKGQDFRNDITVLTGITCGFIELADETFIAHARTDVPMLLEMLEAYEEMFMDMVTNPGEILIRDNRLEKIAEKYK